MPIEKEERWASRMEEGEANNRVESTVNSEGEDEVNIRSKSTTNSENGTIIEGEVNERISAQENGSASIPYIIWNLEEEAYLLDTGSKFILKKGANHTGRRKSFGTLLAANGSMVLVVDKVREELNLGTGKTYTHQFLMADVVCNIQGMDFLTKYGFVLDLARN